MLSPTGLITARSWTTSVISVKQRRISCATSISGSRARDDHVAEEAAQQVVLLLHDARVLRGDVAQPPFEVALQGAVLLQLVVEDAPEDQREQHDHQVLHEGPV